MSDSLLKFRWQFSKKKKTSSISNINICVFSCSEQTLLPVSARCFWAVFIHHWLQLQTAVTSLFSFISVWQTLCIINMLLCLEYDGEVLCGGGMSQAFCTEWKPAVTWPFMEESAHSCCKPTKVLYGVNHQNYECVLVLTFPYLLNISSHFVGILLHFFKH